MDVHIRDDFVTRGPAMTDDEDESDRTIARRPTIVRPEAPVLGHFLSFTDGGAPRRLTIGPLGVTIGRTAPSDIAIAVPDISRRHCRIDLDGEWAVITDLNSTNGTFAGGDRVEGPVRLPGSCLLSLASFQIRYERRDPREVAQEEELAADIQRAADYVRAILPPPIEDGPVRAEWWFVPSAQLGGDAFGYQFLDGDCFCGFVLDVSGHGIGSAMHAANVANVLRRRALPGVDFHDPAQVAAGLNAVFPMEEHNELMLTLWYFVYDLPTRTLRFCVGGHHASYLLSPGGGEPVALTARGPAIGMLPSGRWAVETVAIAAGSRLYIFSDGAFEIIGADGREWDIEDLRAIVAGPSEGGVPEAERTWRRVREAVRPGPLDDDFSVLVVTFV
jgi:serine phosphatase RsbU (regulator of sigma subunit)